jgi:hypothetical protein
LARVVRLAAFDPRARLAAPRGGGYCRINKESRAMEAILPILIFIIATAAVNFYEFGRVD